MTQEERNTINQEGLNFADYEFNVAVLVKIESLTTGMETTTLPEDIARVIAYKNT